MASAAGRKDRYATDVEPRLDEITEWARTMTEQQICENLNISHQTMARYKKAHPELKEAIIKGRTNVVSDLKKTLINRALGYTYTETKVTTERLELNFKQKVMLKQLGYDDDDFKGMKVIRETKAEKHLPPEVTAINRLLINYDKEWQNDPDAMKIKKEELKLKQDKAKEDDDWVAVEDDDNESS